MAALTFGAAQRARRDAESIRADALGLRLALRRQRRVTEARRDACLALMAAVERRRGQGLPSPWSALRWDQDDLESPLEPL